MRDKNLDKLDSKYCARFLKRIRLAVEYFILEYLI